MTSDQKKRVEKLANELRAIRQNISDEKDKLSALYDEVSELEYVAGQSIETLEEAIDLLEDQF